MPANFEAVVIGTGFAGAVTACRLVQAGLHICVLERGRRYEKDDFPRLTAPNPGEVPDFSRLFWTAGQGVWELRDLNGIDIGQAAGYGGGSLIYANVHLRAPEHVFKGWPDGYSRSDLEDYYDLAAYMLQVAPVAGQQFPQGAAPKTAIMEQIAIALGRKGEFFHPPLAVHFDRPTVPQQPTANSPTRRTQQGCQACGNCDIGCEFRAKNTLDFNYLAIAEDAWDEKNGKYADIRTLAEVVAIRPTNPRDPKAGYTVVYHDRLCGSTPVEITADAVFLCAGAVNSTELLLKCKSSTLPNLSDRLGQKYFANADALGITYDTKQPVKPDYGPTITTSLLYTRKASADWFLLQDGGYPPSLRPLFGMFRAPAWLGRNRYLERPLRHRYFEVARRLNELLGRDQATLDQVKARIHAVRERLADANAGAQAMPRSSNRGWVRALSAGHPDDKAARQDVFRFVSHADGGFAPPENDLTIPADAGELFSALIKHAPEQLRKVLLDFKSELSDVAKEEIHSLAPRISNSVVQRLEPKGPFAHFVVDKLVKLFLPRGELYRLTEEETLSALCDWVNRGKLSGPELLIGFLIFLLGLEDPGDNTALFLVMGRDSKPGRLTLQRGELCAILEDRPGHPLYSAEERLMRDYVAELDKLPDGSHPTGPGAQLRVNPAWSFLNRPLSVHNQGGCPMADDPAKGAVDSFGRVHGYEGLYVMDAAIFPRSVGVNPSATILAIAERNIAAWISRRRGERWEALQLKDAVAWANQHRSILDPIGRIESGLPPQGVIEPNALPISFYFDEVMQGFHAEAARGLTHERAEELGRFENTSVTANIHACVPDLARMLDDPKHEISLTANLRIKWPMRAGGLVDTPVIQDYEAEGWLRLFGRQPPTSPTRERLMVYRLDFGPGKNYLLLGYKRLFESAGSDAWRDTTTLFTTIRARGSRRPVAPEDEQDAVVQSFASRDGAFKRRIGIMRVGIDDFLNKQLPSFKVKGTDDEERIAWAFSAFGSFFFSNLEKVYLPEIDRLRPFQ